MRKREAEDRARQEEERRQQEEERTRREAEEKVVVFECCRASYRPLLFSLATNSSVLGQQGLNTLALLMRVMAQGFSLSNIKQKVIKQRAHL